ncbi:hypothetical protein [Lamprocystis purpurea]|uniref:hypothetical protein n=1 Tax=Lamprocystis purpurea TaxID=61598 RepID=UPI001B7FCEAA|nr:hypothetical protein [Lamprocystis purpurea]
MNATERPGDFTMADEDRPPDGPTSAARQGQLINVLGRLMPLIDSLTDKLRNVLLLGGVILGWIAVWMIFIQGWSPLIALMMLGVAALPLLLILRFWWALDDLQDLPATADRMLTDAGGQVQTTLQDLRAGKAPKLGAIASAKGLWSLGALAGEARELLGSYVNFGILLNPLALGLGVLSLLFVLLLAMVGIILAIFTML